MKKIGIIAAVLLLLVSGLVFAQPGGRGPALMDNLTEEQAADLAPILEQMEDLRVQMRESMAEYRVKAMEALAEAGVISQERFEWMKQGWELAENEDQQFQRQSFGFAGQGCHGNSYGRWSTPAEVEPLEPFTGHMQNRRMPRGRW